MKKLISSLFVALAMLTSCEKGVTMDSTGDNSPATSQNTVPVTLSFFDVSMEDLTTPGSRADEDEGETATDENASDLKKGKYFTRLSIAIFPLSEYAGEERHIEQDSIQEDFGRLSINLPVGKYQLIAVAYTGDNPVNIESPTLATYEGNHKVRDMVYASMELDINNPHPTFSCPMDRAITAFTLASHEIFPKWAKAARATFKSHCSYQFNPATSFNTGAKEYSSAVELSEDYVYQDGIPRKITFYTFLDQAERNDVEIVVDLLDGEGNVQHSLNFENVTLVQKKRSTYTGRLFSGDTNGEFTTDIIGGNSLTDNDLQFTF